MKKNKRLIVIFSIIIVCLVAVIVTLSIMLLSKEIDEKPADGEKINTKEYEIENCVAGVDIPIPLEFRKDTLHMNWYSDAVRIFFDSKYDPNNSLANGRDLYSIDKFVGKKFEEEDIDSYCASNFKSYIYIFKETDNLLVDIPNVMNDMENINNFFVVYENEYIKNIKNVTNKKYYQMDNGMYVFYAEMDFDFIGYDDYHTLVLQDDEIKDYKVSMHGDVAFFTDTNKTYMMILGCNNNEFKEGECEAIIQNVKFTGNMPKAVLNICDKEKELININGIVINENNYYRIEYDVNKSLKPMVSNLNNIYCKYDNIKGYINSRIWHQGIGYNLEFYASDSDNLEVVDLAIKKSIGDNIAYYESIGTININEKEFKKYIVYDSDKKYVRGVLYLLNVDSTTICIFARKDIYSGEEVNEDILEYYGYIEYCVEHTVLDTLKVKRSSSKDKVEVNEYFELDPQGVQIWDYDNDAYLDYNDIYSEYFK